MKFRIISLLLLLCLAVGVNAQKTVSGTIIDDTGEPVIGASIIIVGTTIGTVTDFDGNYTLNNVPEDATLRFSFLGYETQDIAVAGQTKISPILVSDTKQIEEIVAVGYGQMKKTDLTGSVSSADGAMLAAKGMTNAMEALQGAVPGASITQSNGRTGGGFDIQIRGKSSINGDSNPLYVVDGIICDNIDFLNAQDIERMDILKDASSTAIYGSRATAGVVMVTTKSGITVKNKKKDVATISYDGYYGISKVARMPDFMNAQEFFDYRFLNFLSSAQVSQGVARVSQPTHFMQTSSYEQGMIFDNNGNSVMKKSLAEGESYDWPSLVTQDGQKQNHYIAINGSTETVNYHFGIGYNREEGVYVNDLQNRYNMKGSVDAKINKFVNAGFSLNLAYTKNSYGSDDAIKIAYRQTPFSKPYIYKDVDGVKTKTLSKKPGNFETLGSNSQYQFTDTWNPLIMLEDDTKESETYRLLGNLYLQVKPFEWLSFKTTFSPNYKSTKTGTYTSDSCDRTEEGSYSQSVSKEWTWDNQIDFNKTFGYHSINAMALLSLNKYDKESSELARSTTDDNGMMTGTTYHNLFAGEANSDNIGTSYVETEMLSYALRLNYSFNGKYMITGTVRADGSSKFSEKKRWGYFPSAAVAWRLSEEEWMSAEWLDNLKLRLSYGVTGNNSVANAYNSTTVSDPSTYAYGNTIAMGYAPSGIINSDLHWEKSNELDFGIDFGFLKNRINGSIDIYKKNSTDLLYKRKLPLVSGGGSLMDNVGEVQNKGFELALTTINYQTKDWSWTTTFTFATNKNEVVKINGESNIIGGIQGSLFVDEPVNNIYAWNWDGIVSDRNINIPNNEAGQKYAEKNGLKVGDQVKSCDYYLDVYKWCEGMPIIEDVDGNGVIEDKDKKVIGSRDPSWTGNIASTLTYKDWDFSFSVYTKQNYYVYSTMLADNYDYSYRGWNNLNMDYYIPAGTLISCDGVNGDGTYINPKYQEVTHHGKFPFPNAAVTNQGMGEFYYVKGTHNLAAIDKVSYWKVKNMTLGYTFPKEILGNTGISFLRLYVNVTDPFVFTKYKGFDPEWAGASMAKDAPSTITYQFGVSLKF